MRNVRLDICYDGTRYRGWQRLAENDNTIQGKLEKTLTRILGEDIEISGSGRTDAGTHAVGQEGTVYIINLNVTTNIFYRIHNHASYELYGYSISAKQSNKSTLLKSRKVTQQPHNQHQ